MSSAHKLIVNNLPHGTSVISPFDGRTLRIICLDSIVDPNSADWWITRICSICPYEHREECSQTNCTNRIITTPETFALKVLTRQIEAP